MANIAFPPTPADNEIHTESGRSWQYDAAKNAWNVVGGTSGAALTLLDEDDFISDSATQAPTQQSTKAYVDNNIAAHVTDEPSAHTAAYIAVADAGARFAGTNVETVLAEIWDAATPTTVIPWSMTIALSDETTSITTGVAKVTFRMPHAVTLTAVRASLSASSSSGTPTFDINENGSTILSTKLTVDVGEKTSTTAATAAVISDTALADDAEITIDIDSSGTGAKGAKVTLIGTRAV